MVKNGYYYNYDIIMGIILNIVPRLECTNIIIQLQLQFQSLMNSELIFN